ncbi:SAV_6107 family HEPN domain-containing protein, partial [Streptomyces virginiae]
PEPVGPRRRPRIRSAWDVLPELAPELAEWSALFASGAARRARAEAGIPDAASARDADDLLRAASMFLRLVERMLAVRAPVQAPSQSPAQTLPQPRPERPDAG